MPLFPIRDDNPTIRPPVLTIALIAICVLVYLVSFGADPATEATIAYRYGLVPARLMGHGELPPDFGAAPAWMTLFTSMFMHGGFMHILGNMLFLWIFGNNIEDELGHGRFMVFYLICGLAAAAAQIAQNPASDIPMVGASGAISGVMGAYLMLYPRAQIHTLVFLGFFLTHMRISAIWYLGIWAGIQGISAIISDSSQGGVAWFAHIGGFVAGVALIHFMRPPRRRGPWG